MKLVNIHLENLSDKKIRIIIGRLKPIRLNPHSEAIVSIPQKKEKLLHRIITTRYADEILIHGYGLYEYENK